MNLLSQMFSDSDCSVESITDHMELNPATQNTEIQEFQSEVASCLSVVELLSRQLTAISAEVETKVIASCSSLMNVVTHTKELVSNTLARINGEHDEASGDELIATTRDVIGNLLERLRERNDFSAAAATEISASSSVTGQLLAFPPRAVLVIQ